MRFRIWIWSGHLWSKCFRLDETLRRWLCRRWHRMRKCFSERIYGRTWSIRFHIWTWSIWTWSSLTSTPLPGWGGDGAEPWNVFAWRFLDEHASDPASGFASEIGHLWPEWFGLGDTLRRWLCRRWCRMMKWFSERIYGRTWSIRFHIWTWSILTWSSLTSTRSN